MILAALVLPLEGGPPPGGVGLRGLFYGLLREEFPEVHQEQPNPFTLSVGGREGQWWVRVTLLREELYARLSPRLFALPGERVRIGPGLYRVRSVLQEGHPWAGLGTFPRLFQGEASHSVHLSFASPTFFRRRGAAYPLPEPRLVVESLAGRWNAFAPAKVPPEVQEALAERLTVAYLEGRTRPVAPTEEERGIGFVGRVGYHLPKASPEEMQWLQALARFAFYAGVGAKTSLGFGRVRPYQPRKQGADDEPE